MSWRWRWRCNRSWRWCCWRWSGSNRGGGRRSWSWSNGYRSGDWLNHVCGNFFRGCRLGGGRSSFGERQHALWRSRRGGDRFDGDRLSRCWCGNWQVYSGWLHWLRNHRRGLDWCGLDWFCNNWCLDNWGSNDRRSSNWLGNSRRFYS